MSATTAIRGWPVAQKTPGTAIRSRFQANAAHSPRSPTQRHPVEPPSTPGGRRGTWGCPGCPTADPPRLTNGVIWEVTVGTRFRSRRVTLGNRRRRASAPSDIEGDLGAEEDKGPEQDRQQRRQDAAKGLEAVKVVIAVGHAHANNHPHHDKE